MVHVGSLEVDIGNIQDATISTSHPHVGSPFAEPRTTARYPWEERFLCLRSMLRLVTCTCMWFGNMRVQLPDGVARSVLLG